MPKVSVIIPVYNGEKYLHKCLDSVTKQTLADIEIICINDCSKDSSINILNDYAKNDSRFVIIDSKVNQGHSKSKNDGMGVAQGDYLLFLDQDDWLELDACELCYNQISKNKNDILMFDFNFCYEKTGDVAPERKRIDAFSDYLDNTNIKLYELSHDYIRSGWAWCYMYDRLFLNKFSVQFPVHNRFVDDVPFLIKALVSAETISVISKPLYNHLENPTSITYTRPDLWTEIFSARKETYSFVLDSKYAKELMNPYLIYCIRSIFYWYERFRRSKNITLKMKHQIFKEQRAFFTELDANHNIAEIAQYIDYKRFRKVINTLDFSNICSNLMTACYSMYNEIIGSYKYKIISVFGLQFKIKIKKV